MDQSKELFLRSQRVLPGGVQSPVRAFKSVGGTPIFFQRGHGAHITDVEGKEYIDFCQGFGPNILGHRNQEVVKAIHEIVDTAWGLGACEPFSLNFAEQIVDTIPFVEKLRFVSSGTEAVMTALRIARAATNRNKIIKLEGCYHGHTDSMLVKAGSGLAHFGAASNSAGVTDKVVSETLVAPLDDLDAIKKILDEHGKDIAALIIEPLPANFGLLKQRPDYLIGLSQLLRQNGSLIIFDEVITGFRVSYGGMSELLGIEPDLVTYGKIIGGGFPVGCCAGKAKYLDLLSPSGPVYQAGTMSGHPVSMVAGQTTLSLLKSQNVYRELENRGKIFEEELKAGLEKLESKFTVARQGSLFWLHYNPSNKTIRAIDQFHPKMEEEYKKLFHSCLEQNIYLPPSAYEVGFLSMAHTEDILSEATEKILAAAKNIR